MFLLKLLLKVFVLPLIALLALIQWIGIFVTSFTEVFMNILAGIFFLMAVASYIMGISNGNEAIQILCIGFVIFILPYIAVWIVMYIETIIIKLKMLVFNRPW